MNDKRYADGPPTPPQTGKVKVEITTVTIFQPGTHPAIYNTNTDDITNIEAGIAAGQPKVVVTKKDGTKIMSVGLPFIVFTDAPKNI